jgi:hypothetical protein
MSCRAIIPHSIEIRQLVSEVIEEQASGQKKIHDFRVVSLFNRLRAKNA